MVGKLMSARRFLFTLLVVVGLAAGGPARAAIPVTGPATIGPAPADDPLAQQGEHLYRVAGCVGCHSPPIEGGVHLGGGRDNPTIFGLFWAPNISPDPEVGIGAWTEQDFRRALRHGRSPRGRAYWPTFPTMAYTKMTDEDVGALWAYLRSQPAVSAEEKKNEIRGVYRLPGLLGVWRMLQFRAGVYKPDPKHDAQWNRGAYLVQAVAYCDQCHTPRGRSGLMQRRHYMAGGANPGKGEIHPNLTPDPEHGIGTWTEDDIVRFLGTGVRPDGGNARPDWVMSEKIEDSYRWFSEEDRRAIAVFLRSLKPDDFDPFSYPWPQPK